MFGIHGFLLFVASGLLLNITPGADMLYTISSSASAGVRAGVTAAFGIFTGTLFHIALAAVGLSALLATSATAFAIVKYLGAAYLVYLGIKLLLDRNSEAGLPESRSAKRSLFEVYKQGVLINLFNPKIAFFFLAFLPQFIDSGSTQRVFAFLALGLTFNFTGTCINSLVAWTADSVRQRINNASRIRYWLQTAGGAVFISLGVILATEGRS